jgi:hypothetical protein
MGPVGGRPIYYVINSYYVISTSDVINICFFHSRLNYSPFLYDYHAIPCYTIRPERRVIEIHERMKENLYDS